jgi:hypothetical protein
MSVNQTQIRHSGEGRNPAEKSTRVADRSAALSCFARICAFNWIPAYAGMTK